MSQPELRVLQIDQVELTNFVNALIGSPVGEPVSSLTQLSDVTIDEPNAGEHLVYVGGVWTNTPFINSMTIGDGLDSDAFEGSPITLQVDSTVARRNATNTFQQANTFTAALVSNSSAAVVMNSAAPGLIFDESDAAADNQVWRVFAEGATLTFDIRNDAGSITNNWLTVGRSGATVGAINLFGTALNFNNQAIHFGSPQPSEGLTASNVGSPAANRVAFFNTDTNITGDADLTFDGNVLTLGDGTASGKEFLLETNATTVRSFMSTRDVGGVKRTILQRESSADTLNFGSTVFGLRLLGGGTDAVHTTGVFRFYNSGQTEYNQMNIGGSNFNNVFSGIGDFTLQGLTGNFWIRDGAGLKISDSADSDHAIFNHDGTDFNLTFGSPHGSTTDWNIIGLGGDMTMSRAGSPSTFEVIQTEKLQTSRVTSTGTDAFSIGKEGAYLVTCGSPSGGFIQIGGISGGTDGKRIVIFNTTAGGPGSPSDPSNLESVVLEHEEATAAAADRILCPNRFDVTLGEYETAELMYDGVLSRWRVISTTHDLSGA